MIVSSQIDRELVARFQAGRQLYNACLNEAMVRVNLIRNSESYQKAKKLPLTIKKGKKYIPNRDEWRLLKVFIMRQLAFV